MTEIVVRFTIPTEHTEAVYPVIAKLIEAISPGMAQIGGTAEVLVDGETVEEVVL